LVANPDHLRHRVALTIFFMPLSSTRSVQSAMTSPACKLALVAQHGFFVADEFLAAATVDSLIHDVESLKADTRTSRARNGVPFAHRNLLEFDFVRGLVASAPVRELLDEIAPGLIAVRAILFDKHGAANWTVPWHQDRSIAVRKRIDVAGFGPWSTKAGVVHVQPPVEILRQMITFRFHLDPCPADNGPLRTIAGTHQRILDQEEVAQFAAVGEQSICTTSAGGLLVMRPLLLHASSPARPPSHRRVIHLEFGPSALPLGLRWAFA
jgi:hypothetical protein